MPLRADSERCSGARAALARLALIRCSIDTAALARRALSVRCSGVVAARRDCPPILLISARRSGVSLSRAFCPDSDRCSGVREAWNRRVASGRHVHVLPRRFAPRNAPMVGFVLHPHGHAPSSGSTSSSMFARASCASTTSPTVVSAPDSRRSFFARCASVRLRTRGATAAITRSRSSEASSRTSGSAPRIASALISVGSSPSLTIAAP